ncbi:50S ribosomal protein L23 [Erysipelotrichaceae bacterium Oil+RF-744-GAM-WT-6]|uniref:Large ribosomal subunit protein uL23 n=2 Tax=Erysipelotrichales TaxID=526525 RepID=A0A7X2NS50_9FIRM|nr:MULTISPECIES: 50S ribosomal protein L23 [Erysipelotrichaceae]MCI2153592.1 50S ribosomal protein L23 [Solobacterium sp.]MDY3232973.1 50S ribosomal protein L23 [Erysipelotrichaceae bacterium]MCI6745925.1 50S ribosomal protein L23 [Anaerolactibacter massiliensis]MDD5881579.1 50S ribosomal protein L23 [Stecheria intestinalis]MDD6366711.1 50S ribosomal protein L23 [Stecheria intestinalis]
MMNARDVIIRPIVTEKSMKLNDQDNKITFEVAKGANKTQVAMAVKEIYNITPVKVNIVNVRPKTKRMGRYVGKTNAVRKAIVKLPEGQDISLFNDENK